HGTAAVRGREAHGRADGQDVRAGEVGVGDMAKASGPGGGQGGWRPPRASGGSGSGKGGGGGDRDSRDARDDAEIVRLLAEISGKVGGDRPSSGGPAPGPQ